MLLPLAQTATAAPDSGFTHDPPPAGDTDAHARLVALDILLQELPRFPGLGHTLLLAGVTSPLVRSRHLALRAIAAWPPPQRDAELLDALRRAHDNEPVAAVQQHFRSVLGAAG